MTFDPKSCIMLPSETTAIVLETLTVIWAAVCVVAVKLIIAKIYRKHNDCRIISYELLCFPMIFRYAPANNESRATL